MRLSATGKLGYWKDKKLPEKTKERMSDIKKGKVFTESHKKSISETLSGKAFTQNHRDALSKTHKGKIPWNINLLYVRWIKPEEVQNTIANRGRLIIDKTS
jgi:hypothetical protein